MAPLPSHLQNLLPDPTLMSVESVQRDVNAISILVRILIKSARCPVCSQSSSSVHSHYVRRLKDLPWHGANVEIRIRARRFRCRNPDCRRRIFAQRIPTIALQHGQQTLRLTETVRLIGYMLGGNPGARLSKRLGISMSSDTILRRLKAPQTAVVAPVRVLGVDDWAWQKGQSYGTVLVDLEAHRVIELLPDRSAQTLTRWLQTHPEVEVISRDRAGAYAEASTSGAPEAIQIADRFHLVCNFSAALERIIEQKMPQIRAAIRQDVDCARQEPQPDLIIPVAADARKSERRERRLDRYNQVLEMYSGGMSQAEICRATGMEKKTVRRFRCNSVFPERAKPQRRASQLDSFELYLRQRWKAGCHNATQLWNEIKSQGYLGQRGMVAQFVSKLRVQGTKYYRKLAARQKPTKLLSPRSVAMLLTKAPEALARAESVTLSSVLQHCPELNELHQLGQGFRRAFQLKSVETLKNWMDQALRSTFGVLHRFASGLRRDYDAVVAAVSLPWSNGQVEGQVHRLKLIKRQMYGRASFQLLRRRVLPYQQIHSINDLHQTCG